MTGSVNYSFSASAGPRIVDRLYPDSPRQVNYKSRLKSFREVFQDVIGQEFPEMLSLAGFKQNPSLEDRLNIPPEGYVVTVPMEHMMKLQPAPVESRQEKLFNSFNQTAKDLTGSLVNMSV